MKPETRSFYERAVQRAIEQIATNLDRALELEAIASAVGLSPFHFHRVFRGMTGETPLELSRRLRMERAAHQLATSDRPVTEIAFDAGYESHEAFTRAFRACYGVSPSGFRSRKHPRIELAALCGVHFDASGRVPGFLPRDSGGRNMEVEIVNLPSKRVFTVRHVGPYNQIPQAFERLGAIAAQAGLLPRPGTEMLAIYHDDPETVPLAELRSDAALSVPEGVPVPEGLSEQRIVEGRYARTLHVGPYERLGDTWARLMGEWLPSSGHRMSSGVSFEIYRNTPADAPIDQLRTELYIPIA